MLTLFLQKKSSIFYVFLCKSVKVLEGLYLFSFFLKTTSLRETASDPCANKCKEHKVVSLYISNGYRHCNIRHH